MISGQPSDVFERGFVYLFDFHPVNPYTYVNIYIYVYERVMDKLENFVHSSELE